MHLLNVGGSLHNADENGLTPLHWTASSPNGDSLITMMVARGADINAVDHYGRTPLHLLAALGRINGVTCLLYHGADVSVRDKESGLLAIDYAIIHCQTTASFRCQADGTTRQFGCRCEWICKRNACKIRLCC